MIAREGYPFIIVSGTLALAAALFGPPAGAVLLLGLTLFVTAFFRDPERVPPGDGRNLVSPADGRIVRVGPGEYPGGPAGTVMLSVFMNVFNVHVNRAPLAGTVARVEPAAGRFINAAADEAPAVNERNLVVLATPHGEVGFCQVAGLVARRIVCRVKPGDALARGQRMGLIRFGSRVDVYVPAAWTVNVKVGDRVRAGESVLAVVPGGAGDGQEA